MKYGPDIVFKFLKKNNLVGIVRGHEYPLNGFEKFASGCLTTVFSATNYCGQRNAGAFLTIRKN